MLRAPNRAATVRERVLIRALDSRTRSCVRASELRENPLPYGRGSVGLVGSVGEPAPLRSGLRSSLDSLASQVKTDDAFQVAGVEFSLLDDG